MRTESKRGRLGSLLFAFLLVVYLCIASLGFPRAAMGQDNAAAPKAGSKPAAKSDASATKGQAGKSTAGKAGTAEDLNIREYVTLLRHNVRLEKTKLMGAMMELDADDAAKFWPIYRDYDAELTKVDDLRVQNIEDYAKAYNDMTDERADELVHSAMQFQQQRNELLARYYGKMKEALGAVTAARFLQVEHQLLLIIDLQIASRLPVVGSK